MKTPDWKAVGVPEIVVNAIKAIPASFLLDTLVHQLVFHNNKKIIVSYNCEMCGFAYTPQRSNEEVSQCGNQQCQSKRVRCIQTLKFSGERKIPYYSRGPKFLHGTIRQMNMNFATYFKSYPERDIDWEWHSNMYHVAFAGGETAQDTLPRVSIAKAAILVPYLWDSKFDWKNSCFLEDADQKFISHFINQLVVRGKS